MPKYKIGKNGKMEVVPDEKKVEAVQQDQFDNLLKDDSDKDVEEMSKTLEELERENNKTGFFGSKPQPKQEVQQPVYQQPQPVYQQPVYQQPQMMQQPQPVYQQPMYQQPVYQQPVYQQPQPVPQLEPVTVTIMIVENYKITVPLDTSNAEDFIQELNIAISEGSTFKVDNVIINCKNIKYYTIN